MKTNINSEIFSPLLQDVIGVASAGRNIYANNTTEQNPEPVACIRVTSINLDYEKQWIEWYNNI